ncbi:MAG TPA: AAA family ATPase [Candidatus Brocadiia bacterium]|nr:AAA family ATPase [Candidatus Brocadiia bacterium]
MRLTRLTIHNFRGIHDASVNLFGYSLLVGPNNAGKSTVIDAIRVFYEKDGFKFKPDRDMPFIKGADQESWLELVFSLSDAENSSLAGNYQHQDRTLRVRKFLKTGDKDRDGAIFGYQPDGSLSTERFYGAKNVQDGKFGDIVFVPAISKVDEHTKLSGPSALRDLLTNILEAVVESSPSYEKFSKDFDAFAQGVKTEKTEDGRSLAGLESELGALLESWGTGFQLDMKSPSITEIIKTLLSYDCIDKAHGRAMTADQFGSGFQRHFIYSLIQIGAKYVGKKPSKKAKDFTPSMSLILFEEPEAFLHPPQQEILAQGLRTLSNNPDRQVICSTHSAHFVSRNAEHIPAMALLKRDNGRITIRQIDGTAWIQIVDANQTINGIAVKWPKLKARLEQDDLKPEMEAVKYFLWLNPDRCGMFFANHVLIVEGPSEQAFINKLLGDGKITRPSDGLYVLDTIGKFNIHRFMNLLATLGIRHSVIHDDDNNSNEHADVNQLIQDSKSQFTVAVSAVPSDVEAFLGVPKPKSDHRKPQHLLYLHETGQIAPEKLRAFCELVEKCLARPSTP